MKKYLYLLICAVTILFAGCRSKQEVSSTYSMYTFGTTCISNNGDGTYDLRVFGNKDNKNAAINQAMINAVNEVIFKGFNCDNQTVLPLLTEVNARERHADFFDIFFRNGGNYVKFVRETSNKDNSRIRSKSNSRENYGIIVTVDRAALKNYLNQEGLIK